MSGRNWKNSKMKGAYEMSQTCPWCQSRMAHNALVCPHCTRSMAEWHQHMLESVSPKRPPAHTLPCHGCGAFVPDDLFGDSRAGDRPGRCPACSCSLDTAYWDGRLDAAMKRIRRCSCGNGRCLPCRGAGNRRVKFWFLKIYVPCSACNGSGSCQVCFNGEYDPNELQQRLNRGEIRKPSEPTDTDFVPPPDWTYWCPVCGARLQSGTNVVCWHCNYGA